MRMCAEGIIVWFQKQQSGSECSTSLSCPKRLVYQRAASRCIEEVVYRVAKVGTFFMVLSEVNKKIPRHESGAVSVEKTIFEVR